MIKITNFEGIRKITNFEGIRKITYFEGIRKCSSAQSSFSEFWSGVPVISRR